MKTHRFEFLDFIRAYAIVLVVMVHAAGPVLYAYNSVPRTTWMIANYFDSFARTCVPLFIMVSGFLLLDPSKEESLQTFFSKRMKKIIIPYVFFSVFYVFWRQTIRTEPLSAWQMVQQLVGGVPDYHLVFMSILIGLYLLSPILRIFVRHAPVALQSYLIGLWFVVICGNFLMNKFVGLSINPYLQVVPLFIGYFMAGSLLRHDRLNYTGSTYVVLILVILAGWLFTAHFTYIYTASAGGQLDETFYGYISPNVVAMTFATFLLIQSPAFLAFFNRAGHLKSIAQKFGSASFGIYLVHVIFLDLLATGFAGHAPSLVLTASRYNAVFSIPLLVVIVLALSLFVVLSAQRLPYLRRLVPQ